MFPFLFCSLLFFQAWGREWVSPDCLEKLRAGEKCANSERPGKLQEKSCPAGKECVDLLKCKTVCTAVSEGNLSRDPAFQEQMKQIHCGLRDLVAPMVCCERGDIAEKIFCSPTQPKTPENSEILPEPIRVKDTCGVRKVFSFNIAGGEDTNPGDWPWMAKLIYSQDNETLCGGTLVSRRHVVTAAHCVNETRPILVRLGDSDLSTEFDCLDVEEGCYSEGSACYEDNECAPRYVDYELENVIVHQEFSFKRLGVPKFDVAVLVLARSVELTDFIKPACLPQPDGFNRGPLAITGWGNTNPGSGPPIPASILQLLNVKEVQLPSCNEQWRSHVDEDLLPSHICVTGVKLGKSACKGDSGGPLVRNLDLGVVWQLAGVVSFGTNNCGNVDLPLGFIRIEGEVNTWLRNIIGDRLPVYPAE